MDHPGNFVRDYLERNRPAKLELGCGSNLKPGWLGTDLQGRDLEGGRKIIELDVRGEFPFSDNSFDFIYCEHMIEHLTYEDGGKMLEECNRIMKIDGVVRIVTPSIGFLSRIISGDSDHLSRIYRAWSVEKFVPEAPAVTNAFFINNFMRAWGHLFIYDLETLTISLNSAGFGDVHMCALNESSHPELRDLENEGRMPVGFLALESMVVEARKVENCKPQVLGINLSIGCPATQSSISQWSLGATPEEDASRASNGKLTGRYNCHTDIEDRPWWRVDLGRRCQIKQVRIYNRIDNNKDVMRKASRFEIHSSDDEKSWLCVFRRDSKSLLPPCFAWTPRERIFGRFVRIMLLDRTHLHLDQVEVFGDNIDPSAQ